MKDAEQTDVTWQRYLQLKRDMQALVQVKISRLNMLFLQKLKSEGQNVAQKFWNYVRTLDRGGAVYSVHYRQRWQPCPGQEGGLDRAPEDCMGHLGVRRTTRSMTGTPKV
ncbi:hypothetical protein MRX96_000298 [Rhipicephalus microplus]